MRFLNIFVFVLAVLVSFTNVETKKSAEEICRLPQPQSFCLALIPKFYYNAATGKCERFYYGGCGRNANNFRTKTQCESLCQGIGPA